MMLTPSGRFKTAKRLCLSMSDFHPESWNPMWSVSTILTGLYSFMLESAPTLGSMEATAAQRALFARASLAFNCKDDAFRTLFPDLVDLHEARRQDDPECDVLDPFSAAGEAPTPKQGDDGGDPQAEPSTLIFAACVGVTLALFALAVASQ